MEEWRLLDMSWLILGMARPLSPFSFSPLKSLTSVLPLIESLIDIYMDRQLDRACFEDEMLKLAREEKVFRTCLGKR
jgi:hypothetical protein